LALLQGNSQSSTQNSVAVAQADASPTPTPFLPLEPTPTYFPTALPTLTATPTPKVEDDINNIQPADELDIPDDQINILVLGSDQRINDGGYRTDAIILVSMNLDTKSVSMISFPRDLYLFTPGWTYERINTVMFHGGFDLISKTMQYNFGILPDYYVLVNFEAFQEIIDKLGGIEVEVASTFKDLYYDGNYKRIPAGTAHMNGATALWYARSRQTSNDFDRTRRQQEVLQAVAKRLISLDAIGNASALYDIYIANVTTNLTWTEITPLIPLAIHLTDVSKVQRYAIGPGEVYDWITPGGAMVLMPRQEKIIALLKEALSNQ
jgi:LCP family protein required for cell wall assembly